MQKLLSSSKPGSKSSRNGKIPKIMRKSKWNVVLRLGAVSEVVVKFC